MITLVEASVDGITPPPKQVTEDQLIKRSLVDKVKHLTEKMERSQTNESLLRVKQNLAAVKEGLSKL